MAWLPFQKIPDIVNDFCISQFKTYPICDTWHKKLFIEGLLYIESMIGNPKSSVKAGLECANN